MDYVDTSADLSAIDETAAAFATKISSLERDINNRRDAVVQSRKHDLRRAGVVESKPDGTKVIDKDRKKSEEDFIMRGVNQQINEYRQQRDAATDAARTAMLAKLQQHSERLDALSTAFPNATAWVSRAGLGSQERSNLQATLSTVGKAGLANYAQQALLSGNRILAAAVVDAVEALPTRDRPFKAIDFAQNLVGDEHKQWLSAIVAAQDKVATALELNRLFVKGGELPADKIGRGLRKRQLAA